MNKIEFDIVGYLPNGAHKLKFTSEEFNDIIFTIGKVSFVETDNGHSTTLQFQYDVLEHNGPFEKDLLDAAVGDLVMQLLDEGVADNSLVYTGGIDATD